MRLMGLGLFAGVHDWHVRSCLFILLIDSALDVIILNIISVQIQTVFNILAY